MSRPCTETEIDHEDVNSALFVASDIKNKNIKQFLNIILPVLSCCLSRGRSAAGLTKVSFPKHSATRFLVPSSWHSQFWNSKAHTDSTWGERLEAGQTLNKEREEEGNFKKTLNVFYSTYVMQILLQSFAKFFGKIYHFYQLKY